jgi:hypothetical protein
MARGSAGARVSVPARELGEEEGIEVLGLSTVVVQIL